MQVCVEKHNSNKMPVWLEGDPMGEGLTQGFLKMKEHGLFAALFPKSLGAMESSQEEVE